MRFVYFVYSLSGMKLGNMRQSLYWGLISIDSLWTAQPLSSLAVLPLSVTLGLSLDININCVATLLSIFEFTNVEVSVWISVCSLSVFFAIFKLTPVFTAISPFHLSFSINFPILKLPNKCLITLLEVVCAEALEQPIYEVTLVIRAITP